MKPIARLIGILDHARPALLIPILLMEPTSESLKCGVCLKPIKDPYKLPCGHTFCLRPCLLAHAKAVTARCIICHLDFNAKDLRPNYQLAAILHLRLQEVSEMANNSSETPKSMDLQEKNDQTRCSACRKSTDAGRLEYCRHCHRSVCSECMDKHFDSYSLPIRIQLTSLQRKETRLSMKLKNLKAKLAETPSSLTSSKANIISELDKAIFQLNSAVIQSVDNATTKVESLDTDGLIALNDKAKKLLDNSFDRKKVGKVYEKLEDNKLKLEDAAKIFLYLKNTEKETKNLLDSLNPLPTMPVMQLELSDRVQQNIETLGELDLLMRDGSVISSPLSHCAGRLMRKDPSTARISTVKVFVGGLKKTHTEEQLKRHFESNYGPLVDCFVARDPDTKESRCFGFVTFKENNHASRALAEFPHFIEGAPIQVRPYKLGQTNNNKTPIGGGSSRKDQQKPGKHRIVVIGISDTATRDSINTALSEIGPVRNVDMESERGFAIVNFEKPETVDLAVHFSTIKIDDSNCKIYPYNIGKQVIKDREGGKGSSSQHIDGLRLFVGNLNPSVNKEMLREYFSKFGSVTKVDIIYEKGSTNPRGIAFVNMSKKQEVEEVLNRRPHLLNGKQIIVRLAHMKDSVQATSLGNAELTAETQMIIHDIPVNTSRQDLLECFSKFGGITALRLDDKRRKGFLNFSSAEALLAAVESSPHQVRNDDLRVSLANDSVVNSSKSEETLDIYVGDISPLTTEFDLKVYFGQFGNVLKANVVKQRTQLYGIVRMASFKEVQKAMSLIAPKICGYWVTIRPFYSKLDAASHKIKVRRAKIKVENQIITGASESTAAVRNKPASVPLSLTSLRYVQEI
ncbi:unnamed protein product [Hymenolepis diminuta]|uniref:RRM domain-containing protein n=1 Tax=Hymenolepis diminuta TaxID=6216 RepID=A0A564Y504_HYMDI|nr:unnamed protein product [Hymenolepis diminuta]